MDCGSGYTLVVEHESGIGTQVEPLGPDFETIYSDQFDYVWASLRRLGVRPADMEDVAQEVFVTVYRRLPSYDPQRPLRPWLFGIAMKVAAAFRRRMHHRREVYHLPGDVQSGEPDPEQLAGASEARQIINTALQSIADSRRPVFILHDIDQQPMREVADALSIPLHTGYSRLHKAREEFAAAVRRLQRNGGGA